MVAQQFEPTGGYVDMVGEDAMSERRNAWIKFQDRMFVPLTTVPTIIASLLVFGIPLTFSLLLSFQGWTIDSALLAGRFVGLANYEDLFTDPLFRSSLLLTIGYTLSTVTLELLFGLGVALLLNSRVPFVRIFRTALIIPMMITPIVAALTWKLLLDPSYGLVNAILGTRTVWLGDPNLALIAVGIVNIWQNTPFVAILLLAGLQSLPSEPVEAAAVDGANSWQTFRHVTLPLLMPYVVVAVLLRTIFEFRSFENIWVMTGGGPANATKLLSVYTFEASFLSFDLTLAAASSWVMLFIVLIFCVFFILATKRKEIQ
ncbi:MULTISPECIES: sugar ABC transporter permease [unclassified Sinorhizobium]|uniref:carbohydrate ABC transporter permease n=1 Tax=unclassified Sinorhizobium TaxID=2613772 RepID=UPI0024C20C78|nr:MULTISPECIES: sugar ABC transporter permease [unclassified Sinorhizobium]MDK1373647.1 sugar ABC transporter permease [Sinorhizobium sp. 6-70]MDK1477791.1 sugar ABC transporter permease [Sinorhizobium sp. 6-117]